MSKQKLLIFQRRYTNFSAIQYVFKNLIVNGAVCGKWNSIM